MINAVALSFETSRRWTPIGDAVATALAFVRVFGRYSEPLSPKRVPFLIGCLHSSSPTTRAMAAAELESIGGAAGRRALGALESALVAEECPGARARIRNALVCLTGEPRHRAKDDVFALPALEAA